MRPSSNGARSGTALLSASTDIATSSDESPVFSDATPLLLKQSSNRTVYDPAIVQAQALKSADPQTNPFNDDQPTPGAKPLPAPPATIPDATGPAEAPIQPAPAPCGREFRLG